MTPSLAAALAAVGAIAINIGGLVWMTYRSLTRHYGPHGICGQAGLTLLVICAVCLAPPNSYVFDGLAIVYVGAYATWMARDTRRLEREIRAMEAALLARLGEQLEAIARSADLERNPRA